ncbi:MAG: hypothetical protein J3T61_08340 [Candidatus Brocadiales bacterium]|nr:hypothetical protein [Candidatus Bathyanammoxibius sp.]
MKDKEQLRQAVDTLEELLQVVDSLQEHRRGHLEAGALFVLESGLRELHGLLLKSSEEPSHDKLWQIANEQFDLIVRIAIQIFSALIYLLSSLGEVMNTRTKYEYWTKYKDHQVVATHEAK